MRCEPVRPAQAPGPPMIHLPGRHAICCPTEKGPSMIYLLLISLQDHVEAAAGLRSMAASLKALKHELGRPSQKIGIAGAQAHLTLIAAPPAKEGICFINEQQQAFPAGLSPVKHGVQLCDGIAAQRSNITAAHDGIVQAGSTSHSLCHQGLACPCIQAMEDSVESLPL